MRSKFFPSPAFLVTTLAASLIGTGSAWAHDGHGMSGAHWHATDAWGFVLAAALSALAVWLGRNDK